MDEERLSSTRGCASTVDFFLLETARIETDIPIAQFPYAYLKTR